MTTGVWPQRPIIVEVATWPWLAALSARAGRPLGLGDVADLDWDALALPGVDAVWLMGVWERSPAGRAICLADPAFRAALLDGLPDGTDDDIVGSAYCVHRYVVDERLGGRAGLAGARAALAERGVSLIVDFVPNHVAIDHPWLDEHPDWFVRGTDDDLDRAPHEFFPTASGPVANGRDPNFAPWTDVAQLNPTTSALRDGVVATLVDIAEQADAVRCDMAMLLLDDVARRTWGSRIGLAPPTPFWTEVIGRVHAIWPDFGFMAEAYWDREADLLAQGFDHCYDKRLYDRLVHGDAAGVRDHLVADPAYQDHLVRFLENHDEPRAAATMSPGRNRAAAVAVATLPGALMIYEGQTQGRRFRPPAQVGRRPPEVADVELEAFWNSLLTVIHDDDLRAGTWSMRSVVGWPDNPAADRLVAWEWIAGTIHHLVVVNLSDSFADGRVWLDAPRAPADGSTVGPSGAGGGAVELIDLLSGARYDRDRGQLAGDGLYVGLPGWGSHLLRFVS